MSKENTSVEEAIRVSHCSADNRDHKCLGTCTITPTGVKLSCPLCGGDEQTLESRLYSYSNRLRTAEIRDICSAMGIEWDSLSAESQLETLERMKRYDCPGCGRHRTHDTTHELCQCGKYRWDAGYGNNGWVKQRANQ